MSDAAFIDQQPVSEQEFNGLMKVTGSFSSQDRLAVAVSGGVDSLCLAQLLHQWTKEHDLMLTVLIVDHGLRSESTQEAQDVALKLQSVGIHAVILTWHHAQTIHSRIQEQARNTRYDLLLTWCQQHQHRFLFLGHHAQDQQETVIFRCLRGSDLWGMAGMSVIRQVRDITLCRPLLSISKSRLKATLNKILLQPIEDPSNINLRFTRVQIRHQPKQYDYSEGGCASVI